MDEEHNQEVSKEWHLAPGLDHPDPDHRDRLCITNLIVINLVSALILGMTAKIICLLLVLIWNKRKENRIHTQSQILRPSLLDF